jgi:acetyl-CoA carboxylase biotin carboxyl carrier protein
MAPSRGPARPPAPAPGGDDRVVELTRRLAAVLAELGLSEVEIESQDVRVRVQRASAPAAAPVAAAALPAPAPPDHLVVTDVVSSALVTMEAPMVGTFYRAASPTADPFVHEGDVVKEGQVLGIIEAMKLMNEIESKVAGRIARVLVENAQAVEYGQPLFLIDPQS